MSKNLTPKQTLLVIYGQEMWHTEAKILGNSESLKRLRDAIDRTIHSEEDKRGNKISCEEFMQDDGEGYSLVVICDEKFDFSPEDKNDYPISYMDDVAQEKDEKKWNSFANVYSDELINHLHKLKQTNKKA